MAITSDADPLGLGLAGRVLDGDVLVCVDGDRALIGSGVPGACRRAGIPVIATKAANTGESGYFVVIVALMIAAANGLSRPETALAVALVLSPVALWAAGTRAVFVAFLAVAFAISSLPVAARVLGDLGMLHRPFAQLALAVATFNDIVGWVLLGAVASLAESGRIAPRSLIVALVGAC